MPFPFRLRKRPGDADDSDSSQHSSVPTLPPIQRVASNNGDDWFSGSDSGHGESQDETSDATRSEPPRSVVTGSVTSKQASRRPKKHVTIPKSENDDERQPGLIAELEQELAAVEAELAHAPRRGRRQLEQEVEHLKSELNSAREERKRLPGQIEAYEKEVRKLKDREREEVPTGRILRAFLKLRSADEASDLERIYLRALEQNPHVTANNDSIYGPRTALHRGFHKMMRHQPPPEKDPRLGLG
ncbi:hypothetical protein BMF94_0400 [Rhodotorula taiwanensis]|uniref:Uncharacterized protein n=1 Tax=Rhodotorula taiwanensis TaxID=741276 RepID=A0A2S5BHH1_9BASI|nr:hypothetical protein BMF94_0400 [Rhodotorula taiwanensis]